MPWARGPRTAVGGQWLLAASLAPEDLLDSGPWCPGGERLPLTTGLQAVGHLLGLCR